MSKDQNMLLYSAALLIVGFAIGYVLFNCG